MFLRIERGNNALDRGFLLRELELLVRRGPVIFQVLRSGIRVQGHELPLSPQEVHNMANRNDPDVRAE